MIIDLHNHTTKYSACSIIDVDTLINIYIERHIDGIAITDHNHNWSIQDQSNVLQKYSNKIKIFFGMELNTNIGDVLVFCKNICDYDNLYKKMDVKNIFHNISKDDIATIWAHPYRYSDDPDTFIDNGYLDYLDAIELYNGNLSDAQIDYTKQKLENINIYRTGGSDTHSTNMATKYATCFNQDISDLPSLVDAIKKGDYYPIDIAKFK